jgi:hypothetical protein
MNVRPGGYHWIVAESYAVPNQIAVKIRPIAGQVFDTDLNVRCDASLRETTRYPLGSRFNVKVKLSSMAGGEEFLHSPHQWPTSVNLDGKALRR